MAASLALAFESLSPADKQRVNETCERFEELLSQGQAARAEECLDDIKEPLRTLLLHELLLLECEYCFRRLEPPAREELARRLRGRDDLAGEILDLARANALSHTPDLHAASWGDAAAWLEATGRFRILRVLGRGGFGVVYLADAPHLGGEVAVKTPLPELLLLPEFRARFVREAQAAAALDHPHIVRVLEVGEAGPVCYLVSAYVSGPNLAQWLRTQPGVVPTPLAVAVVRRLAGAVAFAHQAGVLHCDLKPANVLVGSGPAPEPRVTDFGLAHLTGESAALTRTGQVLGTPMYMAPEQAQGKRREVTPQTDVYALGIILYEMLAGRPPFPAGPVAEVLHRVVYDEPVGLRVHRPDVPRDLEAVCLRCLEKKSADRYASAAALADDLGRVLEGKPPHARPPGLLRRSRRWARRRPATAAAALLVLALVVLGLGGGAYHLRHLESANQQLSRALQERNLLVGELAQERNQLQAKETHLRRQLYPEMIRRARQLLDRNECRAFLETLAEWQPQPGQEDLRGFEWYYLQRCLGRGECGRLQCANEDIYTVAYAPDGESFAAGGKDGRVRLCSASPLRVLHELPHPDEVGQVLYSTDGSLLATACDDGTVRLWSRDGRLLASLAGHRGKVRALAFSPDGRTLASSADDPVVRLWQAHEPQRPPQTVDHGPWGEVKDLAFAEGGAVLLTGGENKSVQFFRLADGRHYAQLALGDFKAGILAMAPGERFLAVAYPGGQVQLWDTAGKGGNPDKWQAVSTADGFQRVRCLSFSPDASALLIAGDRSVQVWDTRPFRLRHVVRGHEGRVWAASFRPRGTHALTAGTDGTVRCLELAALTDAHTVEFETGLPRLVFLPDSSGLLVLGLKAHWIPLPPSAPHAGCEEVRGADDLHTGVFPGNGRALVSMDRLGHVDRWDLPLPPGGESVQPARLLHLAPHLDHDRKSLFGPGALSGDGSLAALREGATVRLWQVASGRPIAAVAGHKREVTVLAFGPGAVLASGSSDATVKLWDGATGRPLATCAGHTGAIRALAFSPYGHHLASASNDQAVRVWDWRTGAERLRLLGHHGIVHGIAYSPDGRTLASAGADGTVRLWQAATGRELLALTAGVCFWSCVAFSPDGRYLALVRQPQFGPGHVVHLWDAAEPMSNHPGH
jgi:WD40 repeat protein/serine/threonine protein kinase